MSVRLTVANLLTPTNRLTAESDWRDGTAAHATSVDSALALPKLPPCPRTAATEPTAGRSSAGSPIPSISRSRPRADSAGVSTT